MASDSKEEIDLCKASDSKEEIDLCKASDSKEEIDLCNIKPTEGAPLEVHEQAVVKVECDVHIKEDVENIGNNVKEEVLEVFDGIVKEIDVDDFPLSVRLRWKRQRTTFHQLVSSSVDSKACCNHFSNEASAGCTRFSSEASADCTVFKSDASAGCNGFNSEASVGCNGFNGSGGEVEKVTINNFSNIREVIFNVTRDTATAFNWLKQHKLIPVEGTPCPECVKSNRKGTLKYYNSQKDQRKGSVRLQCSGAGKKCRIKYSPFKGTFFDGNVCKTDLCKMLELLYYWLYKYSVQRVVKETGVGKRKVLDYFNCCREICSLSLMDSFHVIGGPGKVVEINEFKNFKRKYKLGKVVNMQQEGWIFGGIQRDNGDVFMVRVTSCDKTTLLPMIKKYIKEGTCIVSDDWKAYSDLDEEGYLHNSDGRKRMFVSPSDPRIYTRNTDSVANTWWHAKSMYPENWTCEELKESYMQEFLYRRSHPDIVTDFFHDMKKYYKSRLIN